MPQGNDISNVKPGNILGMLKSIKLCSIDTTLSATQARQYFQHYYTCKATNWDEITPDDGRGCAGSGDDNDEDFTSDSSGSGLEIICPCANKINIWTCIFIIHWTKTKKMHKDSWQLWIIIFCLWF